LLRKDNIFPGFIHHVNVFLIPSGSSFWYRKEKDIINKEKMHLPKKNEEGIIMWQR
jgi:hypothetical protein